MLGALAIACVLTVAGWAVLRHDAPAAPPACPPSPWTPGVPVSGRWKNIVVHHSATAGGGAEGFDRYHREKRKMPNGLAYHFLIGNGRGMPDGAVFASRRWMEQLDGGHVRGEENNRVSIGICLVGDFTKTEPTAAQSAALSEILDHLFETLPLDESNVHAHGAFAGQKTLCPGDRLRLDEFLDERKKPCPAPSFSTSTEPSSIPSPTSPPR